MTRVTFPCPACQQMLRAPVDKAGCKAKCGKCGTTVMIPSDAAEVTPEVAEIVEELDPAPTADNDEGDTRFRFPRHRDNQDGRAGDEDCPLSLRHRDHIVADNNEGSDPDRRRSRAERAYGDGEEERARERDDDEDGEGPRRRRRKRRRRRLADPAVLVYGPATALRICGFVGIAAGILVVTLNVLQLIGGGGPGPRMPGPAPAIGPYVIGLIFGSVMTFVWCGFLIKGSEAMSSLRGYGMAMATCIIAMLPCNLAWLGGLPFSIWGLVVLCNKDVKEAFR